MIAILEKTAWPMQPPTMYGPFHLLFVLCGLLILIPLAYILRKLNAKQSRFLILIIGLLLLASELYKQLFNYYIVHDSTYYWWIFPFQLCSIPMYTATLSGLMRDGKVRDTLLSFTLGFGLLGGIFALGYPQGLMHSYWTLTLHSFLWHLIQIFLSIFIGFNHSIRKSSQLFKRTVPLLLILFLIAYTINLIVIKNYNASINMFYIGPQMPTAPIFKDIAKNFGILAYQIVYIVGVTLGGWLCYYPFIKKLEALASSIN